MGFLAHLVRALHRDRRSQGFESCTSQNFFTLSFRNCKSCVYNCDDLRSCKTYFCGVSLKHLPVCFVRKDHPVFINFQSMPQLPDLYILKLCTQLYLPSNFKPMEFGENCRLSPFDYGLPGLISKFGFLLKFNAC